MFFKILLTTTLSALLFLIVSCSSKSNHNTTSVVKKHKALIIAVGDYEGSNSDLYGIDVDSQNMERLFTHWGFDVEVLQNPLDFENRMSYYAQTLTSDDVFAIYYSGHGTFVNDVNGDEVDHRDEMIVLSDASTNLFMIDDKINMILNKVAARKLIIFDSCHSGTATKAHPINTKEKYLPAPKSVRDAQASPQNKLPNTLIGGEYLYFAACKDTERSLASPEGSYYTNAFKENVSLSQSANTLLQKTRGKLELYFTPMLQSSSENIKNISLGSFLKL